MGGSPPPLAPSQTRPCYHPLRYATVCNMSRPQEKDRRVMTQLDQADYRALALEAEENGRSISAEVKMAVKAWLKKAGRRT